MSNDLFEEKGQAFWQWLEKNGATLSKDIAIKDYRGEGAGRGVVAKQPIKVHFFLTCQRQKRNKRVLITRAVRKEKFYSRFLVPFCYLK